jgi:hypothetical protein
MTCERVVKPRVAANKAKQQLGQNESCAKPKPTRADAKLHGFSSSRDSHGLALYLTMAMTIDNELYEPDCVVRLRG